MNLKQFVILGLLLLIYCCFRRQRRYLIELSANAPSTSIRAGYRFSIIISLFFIFFPTELTIFQSIIIVCLFLFKITISPTLIGITLIICTLNYHIYDVFPFYEVWSSIVSMLFWRLPEEMRAMFTIIGLAWSSLHLLSPRLMQRLTFNLF